MRQWRQAGGGAKWLAAISLVLLSAGSARAGLEDIGYPSFGKKQPLFRRASASAVVTIFDGGHEIVPGAALAWIERRYNELQAAPVEQ